MRIAQIVLPHAPEYEKKSQRADREILAANGFDVVAFDIAAAVDTDIDAVADARADVAHVYGPAELPSAFFRRFPIPYVASGDVRQGRWPFNRPIAPRYVVSPLAEKAEQSRIQSLPEAVEDRYFVEPNPLRKEEGVYRVGSFARPSIVELVQLTLARIQRFRGDISWTLYDRVPTAADLTAVDVWVDPATSDSDLDGFTAEAMVAQVAVIAARTTINTLRLEKGRTGFLVPPRDPNELTHAILGALFKPETAQRKIEAAQQTRSKFRARQRLRILARLYETLIP